MSVRNFTTKYFQRWGLFISLIFINLYCKNYKMNNFSFSQNEDKYLGFLKKHREEIGVKCKKCTSLDHYWLTSKKMWQCKKCRFRTSLTSGTVLENTKLPLWKWFHVIHYLTWTKKGFSSKELQRLINQKRYEPVWAMVHKIRKRMGHVEELKKLSTDLVCHPGQVVTLCKWPFPEFSNQLKSSILIFKDNKNGHLNMSSLNVFPFRVKKSKLVRDRPNTYFFETEEVHVDCVKRVEFLKYELLNLKKKISGIHHNIKVDYLSNYMSEFIYKRNGWGKNLFERLLADLCGIMWQSSGHS
jgi:hypothetical protein